MLKRLVVLTLGLIFLYMLTRRSDRLRTMLSNLTSFFSEVWGALVKK